MAPSFGPPRGSGGGNNTALILGIAILVIVLALYYYNTRETTGCKTVGYDEYSSDYDIADATKCVTPNIKGCMTEGYYAYNPQANVDDDSCGTVCLNNNWNYTEADGCTENPKCRDGGSLLFGSYENEGDCGGPDDCNEDMGYTWDPGEGKCLGSEEDGEENETLSNLFTGIFSGWVQSKADDATDLDIVDSAEDCRKAAMGGEHGAFTYDSDDGTCIGFNVDDGSSIHSSETGNKVSGCVNFGNIDGCIIPDPITSDGWIDNKVNVEDSIDSPSVGSCFKYAQLQGKQAFTYDSGDNTCLVFDVDEDSSINASSGNKESGCVNFGNIDTNCTTELTYPYAAGYVDTSDYKVDSVNKGDFSNIYSIEECRRKADDDSRHAFTYKPDTNECVTFEVDDVPFISMSGIDGTVMSGCKDTTVSIQSGCKNPLPNTIGAMGVDKSYFGGSVSSNITNVKDIEGKETFEECKAAAEYRRNNNPNEGYNAFSYRTVNFSDDNLKNACKVFTMKSDSYNEGTNLSPTDDMVSGCLPADVYNIEDGCKEPYTLPDGIEFGYNFISSINTGAGCTYKEGSEEGYIYCDDDGNLDNDDTKFNIHEDGKITNLKNNIGGACKSRNNKLYCGQDGEGDKFRIYDFSNKILNVDENNDDTTSLGVLLYNKTTGKLCRGDRDGLICDNTMSPNEVDEIKNKSRGKVLHKYIFNVHDNESSTAPKVYHTLQSPYGSGHLCRVTSNSDKIMCDDQQDPSVSADTQDDTYNIDDKSEIQFIPQDDSDEWDKAYITTNSKVYYRIYSRVNGKYYKRDSSSGIVRANGTYNNASIFYFKVSTCTESSCAEGFHMLYVKDQDDPTGATTEQCYVTTAGTDDKYLKCSSDDINELDIDFKHKRFQSRYAIEY